MSVPRLLLVFLILEIATVITGVWLYKQGPTPYSMILSSSSTKNYKLEAGKWLIDTLEFPTGKVHAKFGLNMTISMMFNYTDPKLIVFLFNETQVAHWNNSKTDYVLMRSYPNYNFSLQVEPDNYYLTINGTHLEVDNNIQAFLNIKATVQNFDYSRVWPSLCLVLAGVTAVNINITLMKRHHMFRKLNPFFRKFFVPRTSFPGRSAYIKYSSEAYSEFAKPLLTWSVQFLPALITVFLIFKISPRETSPFTNVAWDYVALAAVTTYFTLLAFIALFFFMLLCFISTFAHLHFAISGKLGLLKAIDVSTVSKIGTLIVSRLRKRTNIPILSIPLIVFAFVITMTPYSLSQGVNLPYVLWITIVLMMIYYGLVFSYIKSSSMKEFLAQHHPRTKRHFSARLRLQSLIEAVITTSGDLIFFVVTCGIVVSLFSYVIMPILSSSLAVKYGLASLPSISPFEVLTMLIKVVLLALLLTWSIFYGITGYLVPELIERGLRGFFVGLVVLILTFLTDRILSMIFDPYLRIDWTLSFSASFMIFALVLIFEKFYRRMLQKHAN